MSEEIIFTITNGALCIRDGGGYETRNPSSIRMIKEALSSVNILDGMFVVSTGDSPISLAGSKPHKVFSYSTREGYDDISIPDFIFDQWSQAGIDNYTEITKKVVEAGKKSPTDNRVFWSGTVSGEARINFVRLARDRPDLISANDILWKPPSDGSMHLTTEGNKYVSLPEHCQYKYLIDLAPDGKYSGRVKILMFSGRLLFLTDRTCQEFYYQWMRPYEHYVPVKKDLSDLVEKIEWANANPEECQRIANNALQLACEKLTYKAAIDYLRECLKKHLGDTPMKLQAILFGGRNISRLSFTLDGFCRFHPDVPVLVVNTSRNDLSGIVSRFKNVFLIHSGDIWHNKCCCGSFDPRYFGLLAGYGCNPQYTHTIYLEDDVQTLRRVTEEPKYDVAGNYYYLDNVHYCLYQYLGLKQPYLQSGAGGTIFNNRFLKSLSDNMDIIYDLYARFPGSFYCDLVCTAVALKLGFTVGIWEELECNVRMFNPHYLVENPALRHPVKVDIVNDPSLRHSVKKNNPCVVTAYTPNIASLGDFTSAIAKTYCDKHGYALRVHTTGFDAIRHPTWSKVLFLREALREHPWAFWIDSDAIFTNHDIKIESFIQMGGDFFICRDFPHNMFNAGVLLIRSCEWSFWFLDEVWKREDLANRTFHEQEALTDLYKAGMLGQHIVWYGTRAFNSFAYTTPDLLRGEPESLYQWQKGDFVAHCPARPDRLEVLQRIAKESI